MQIPYTLFLEKKNRKSKMEKEKTKIYFIPTWQCPLQCGYCDYRTVSAGRGGDEGNGYKLECFGNDYYIESEIDYNDWLCSLNIYKPFHLEITGGEPLMYEGFPELINGLPEGCTWAVTANTLLSSEIKKLHFDKCPSWTASYHDVAKDKFTINATFIKAHRVNTNIT